MKLRPSTGDDAQRGEEIAGNFNGVKLPGLANPRKLVLQRVVEGLECGDVLEGLIVALEFTKDVDSIGFGGEAAGRAHFGIEAFSGGEPHQLMRLRERQRTQQHGVHDAEDRGIQANTKREHQDSDGGKCRIVAQGAERVAGILQPLGVVIADASASFHVLSYALACMLHSEHVAELALGFVAGGFGMPAVSDQVFRLAFDVKAQFGLYVGLWVRTENAIVPAPDGDLLHEVSGVGGWVAPENLGDGFSVRFPCLGFGAKVTAALAGQLVILRFPVVVRETPFGFNESLAFEAPQCGIKRAFFDEEGFVTLTTDEAR